MNSSTATWVIVAVFAIAALLAARAGIRSLQAARTVVFFRTRRERMVAGRQWLMASFVLVALTVASAVYGKPFANQIFSPTPPLASSFTLTPLLVNTDIPTFTSTTGGTTTISSTSVPVELSATQTPPPSATASQTLSSSTVTATTAPSSTSTADNRLLATAATQTALKQAFLEALSATPTATRTPVPTWTRTPTRTPPPTWTPSPTRTPRPTATASPSRTVTATATTTVTATLSFTPSATITQRPTSTTTSTKTPLPTLTVSPTRTPQPSATASPSRTMTGTATTTVTLTMTFTPSATFTQRPTSTTTSTRTPLPTLTVSPTRTPQPSATASPSRTFTSTSTATQIPSLTFTPSQTFTATSTKTAIPSQTSSPTRTPPPSATSTSTLTQIPIPTVTSSSTSTARPTSTLTVTNTQTITLTSTWTPTITKTLTLTPSRTATFTPSATRTPLQTPTGTSTITLTPTRTPTQSLTPTPNLGCDRIGFVTDLNVPRNSVFVTGSSFTKIWRLKNVGTCTWKTNYRLVLVSGDLLGGQYLMPLPREVAPGETIDLAMKFKAPQVPGTYRGNWQIRNGDGEIFGTTVNANRPFSVAIRVETPATTEPAYNFALNVCSAQWSSGAGNIRCPSVGASANGFILRQPITRLEDGSALFQPSFLVAPQNVFNGYISGVYPSFNVQQGDHLQAIIQCGYQATSCKVMFRVDYRLGDGTLQDFWEANEQYDEKSSNVDIDLSSLAGQEVRFVLTVLSVGQATGDRAVWVEPRIVRSAPPIVSTPTP